MGSKINLVLGDGVGKKEFVVPVIVGLTYGEAKARLEENGLGIGAIVAGGVRDTMNAYIWKQNPERFDEEKKVLRIRPGQLIDVWLQVDKPVKDTTENVPLSPELFPH
jgi:hypothetical protein